MTRGFTIGQDLKVLESDPRKEKTMTYEEAKEMLKGRNSKKIGNNTYLVDLENRIVVRLHDTNVVTFYEDGKVKLNSGGWQTVTTKDRMNKYLPVPWKVFQEKFEWYLWNWKTKEKREYQDNMFV